MHSLEISEDGGLAQMCWVLASRHLGESWRFALMPGTELGRKSRVPGQRKARDSEACGRDTLPGLRWAWGGAPGLVMWLYSSWTRTVSSVVGFQVKHWGQNLPHSSAQ